MANGLILLAGIGLLILLVLARQIPLQLLARIVAPVFRPVMRIFRIKPRDRKSVV